MSRIDEIRERLGENEYYARKYDREHSELINARYDYAEDVTYLLNELKQVQKHALSERECQLLNAILAGIDVMKRTNPKYHDEINNLFTHLCTMYPLPKVEFTAEGAGRAMAAMMGGGAWES